MSDVGEQGQTRPFEYYRIYQRRLEHANDVLKGRVVFVLYVQTVAFMVAVAACCVEWLTLVRQAEILSYHNDYFEIVATSCVAFVVFAAMHFALCYGAGIRLVRRMRVMVDRSTREWDVLKKEYLKIKGLGDGDSRTLGEWFPIASTEGDGLWLTFGCSGCLDDVLWVVRLMWWAVFVSGVTFCIVQGCMLWSALHAVRSILL